MDIVADAVECNTRPEIAQYFKMTVAELDLVSAAPSRATLVAMDKKRRMTPRSAGRPNINEGAEVDLKFDGEAALGVGQATLDNPAEASRVVAQEWAPGKVFTQRLKRRTSQS